jgi:hypothetical protein
VIYFWTLICSVGICIPFLFDHILFERKLNFE